MRAFAIRGFAMKRLLVFEAIVGLALGLLLTSCGKVTAQETLNVANTGPVPINVQPDLDANNFKVDHPDQFPLVAAGEHVAAPELNVTGVVSPDVSLQVPVPSLATGRIVEIDARPSDCLALATAQKRPIYVSSALFEQVEDMTEYLERISENSGESEESE